MADFRDLATRVPATAIASSGDAQFTQTIHRNRTTDATPTALTTDSGTIPANNTIFTLQNYSIQSITVHLDAIEQGTTNTGNWELQFSLVRGVNAASTTTKGVTIVQHHNDLGVVMDASAVVADTVLGGGYIEVTGLVATNIQWVAQAEFVENVYA